MDLLLKLTLLILLGLSFKTQAEEFKAPLYELQELKFSNRASCAVESGKPSQSAFLLVSNVDAAKAIYRLAKFRGDDVEATTKMGIDRFRYSIVTMINLIHKRLTSRELPLLPADITNGDGGHIPSRYKDIMSGCRQGEYCEALDEYLGDIWAIASKDWNSGTKYLKFFDVDNYHSEDNYLTKKDYDKGADREMTCAYLKKFSPLQAHLYGTKPSQSALSAIADAVANEDKEFAACDDFSAQENLQVAAYELGLPDLKEKGLFRKETWLEKGFDYWHSLKLYLSYAFRYAPEMDAMAYPFAPLFRGVTLEESVMLVPNGCRSLAPAKCDGDRLALNSIREFAKEDFEKEALDLDILSEVPDGPDNDLVNDMIPSVNVDELDLAAHQSASDWLENFSSNLSRSRALMKTRLLKAVNHFNFLTRSISVEKLVSLLDAQYHGVLVSHSFEKLAQADKNNLYYLCSEFSFAQHEKWSFIRQNLELLKNSTAVGNLTSEITTVSVEKAYAYFTKLGDTINSACYALNQKDIWDDEFALDKEGFNKWYTSKVYDNKVESKYEERLTELLKTQKPLLAFPQYKESAALSDVICVNASDCARKTIEATLSFYAATQYANTFWSLEEKIKSPDLFNPYAERTACKVYDPWYKTRSTLFSFLWDMGQTAASAFVPGMIYTKAQLNPRMVTSFNELIRDGKIEYDTQYEKQKILSALTADFGPLTGVPCQVSVNRNPGNPFDYLRFTGITVGACNADRNYNIDVYSASEIGPNVSSGASQCLSCSLNFESMSGLVARVSSNVGPVFFLVRGIYNLYKALKDPYNIPRSWEVHPYNAYETKALYGEIPKKCVRSLRKGKSCLDPCEEAASELVRENLGGYIKSFNLDDWGWGTVQHSHCAKAIKVKTYLSRDDNGRDSSCRASKMEVPASCKELLK